MRTISVAAVVILATLPVLLHGQVAAAPKPSSSHLSGSQPATDLLDINTATVDQLKALPGFGLAYARRVIAGRPYIGKNQLVTRGVIPLEAYNKVAPLIIAHHLRR